MRSHLGSYIHLTNAFCVSAVCRGGWHINKQNNRIPAIKEPSVWWRICIGTIIPPLQRKGKNRKLGESTGGIIQIRDRKRQVEWAGKAKLRKLHLI